jgi:ankyrin repeat protein
MQIDLRDCVRLLLDMNGYPVYANSKGEDALTIATKFASFPAVSELFLRGVHPLLHNPVRLTMGECTERVLPSGRVEYSVDPDEYTDLPTTVGTAVSIAFSMPSIDSSGTPTTDGELAAEKDDRDKILQKFLHRCKHVNSDTLTLKHDGIEYRLQSLDSTVQDDTLLFDSLRRDLQYTASCLAQRFSAMSSIIMDPNMGSDMFGNGPLHYAVSYHHEGICRNLVRRGADMLKLAVPPRPLPDPMPDLTGHMATISRGDMTPMDIMRITEGSPHYPSGLDGSEGRMEFYHAVRKLNKIFHTAIMGMWRWQTNTHVRQEVLAPYQTIARYYSPNHFRDLEDREDHVRQSIYRGKSFDGWHALPRDVVRIIIGHMLNPWFHPAALQARLRRFDELHRLHMDRMVREDALFELA